jgi:hypothetical protein
MSFMRRWTRGSMEVPRNVRKRHKKSILTISFNCIGRQRVLDLQNKENQILQNANHHLQEIIREQLLLLPFHYLRQPQQSWYRRLNLVHFLSFLFLNLLDKE